MKKLLSLLLCFALAAGLVPAVSAAEPVPVVPEVAPPAPAAGADVWDGSTEQPTQLVKKGGEDYYEITTCAQLAYVAQTGGDWLGYNYILANDLILNDVEITTEDGGYCASCVVTVHREYAYELGKMIFRDSDGSILPAIPDGDFLVGVPITKKAAEGDAVVLLASYDARGALLEVSLNMVYDLGQGQSFQMGFRVKNSGEVAKLKAFVVSSLREMRPLCPAVEAVR